MVVFGRKGISAEATRDKTKEIRAETTVSDQDSKECAEATDYIQKERKNIVTISPTASHHGSVRTWKFILRHLFGNEITQVTVFGTSIEITGITFEQRFKKVKHGKHEHNHKNKIETSRSWMHGNHQ